MAAVSTLGPHEATYRGSTGREPRIDFICAPASLVTAIRGCGVLRASSGRLQLTPDNQWRDHRALGISLAFDFASMVAPPPGPRWD